MLATTTIATALTLVLMFAVLIQFCVDRVKGIVGEKVMSYVKAPVWALVFGLLFAFLFNLDVFAMFGLSAAIPIASQLVTGLILSAGAAPIHELIEKLRQSRLNSAVPLSFGTIVSSEVGNITLEQRKDSNVYAKTEPPEKSEVGK